MAPRARVRSVRQLFEYSFETLGIETPKLPPQRHRRPADLLKLPNPPRRRPGLDPLRGCLRLRPVKIGIQAEAVDVLRNVFRDIARRTAFSGINGNSLKAMFHRTRFVAVLGKAIVRKDRPHFGDLLGRKEQQQMPMWRAVVLRFGNAQPVRPDTAPIKLRPYTAPDFRKIGLRFLWRGHVVHGVGLAGLVQARVHPARTGHGVKLAHVAPFTGEQLDPRDAHHQLASPYLWVCYRQVGLLLQGVLLAKLIDRIQGFQNTAIAGSLLPAPAYALITGIDAGVTMDEAEADGRTLYACGVESAQHPPPPMRITQPVDRAGDGYPFSRYRCRHSDEPGKRCHYRQGALNERAAPFNRSALRRVTFRRKTNRIVIGCEPQAARSEFAFYPKQLQVRDSETLGLVLFAIARRLGRGEGIRNVPKYLMTKTPVRAVRIGDAPERALGAVDVVGRRNGSGEGRGPVHGDAPWSLVDLRIREAKLVSRSEGRWR